MKRNVSWRRLRRIFRRDPTREVDEELRYHQDRRVAEYVARGMDPEAAHRTALERLGDLERVRAECSGLNDGPRVRARHHHVAGRGEVARRRRRVPAGTAQPPGGRRKHGAACSDAAPSSKHPAMTRSGFRLPKYGRNAFMQRIMARPGPWGNGGIALDEALTPVPHP